jgi:hypothetical protein
MSSKSKDAKAYKVSPVPAKARSVIFGTSKGPRWAWTRGLKIGLSRNTLGAWFVFWKPDQTGRGAGRVNAMSE